MLKTESLFVFFAVTFGMILLFLTPPFQTPDEPNHFYRAFSISMGNISDIKINGKAGNYLPSNLLKFVSESTPYALGAVVPGEISKEKIINSANIKNNSELSFYEFPNTVLYSPAAYLPQTTSIKIFRLFTDSVYWLFIGGRLFNLLFYVILGYFAIKSCPFLKWQTALILLLPMNLSLAASVSPDPVLLSVTVLYFAKILQFSFDKDKVINWKQVWMLSILAVFIGLIKQNYLFIFFILIIPKHRFGNNFFKKLTAVFLPSLILTLLWTKIAASIYIPLNGADPHEQVKHILTSSTSYITVLCKCICQNTKTLYHQIIGVLGWLNIYMAHKFYASALIFGIMNIIFSKNKQDDKFHLPLINNIFLITMIVSIFVYLYTALYLSYTPPGYEKIIGIQGRYFEILLLPLSAFFAMNIKTTYTNKYIAQANIIFLAIMYLCLFRELHAVFYI